MGNASISIIIAASQTPASVAATLASVAAQNTQVCEAIIVGATGRIDLTALRQLASVSAMSLRVYTHSEPPYLAHDLNVALPLARGDYTTFMEAGETWHPQTLTDLTAALAEHAWSYAAGELPALPDTRENALQSVVESGHAVTALLFPRELAETLAPLDPATAPGERWDIALQLSLQAAGGHSSTVPAAGRTPDAACAAQILRKHAIRLKTQLPNFAESIERSIAATASDPATSARARRSITLPYLDIGEETGANLAFLVSSPRSGSTLLQRILASHPDLHTQPEPWIMLHPCHGLRESDVDGDYEPALAARAVKGFLEHTGGGTGLYTEAIRCMTDRLYAAALHGSAARVFLDKTPRYYHILPELRDIYPHARFVFLLRHPLAVVASALDTWFDGDVEAFRKNKNALDCIAGPRRIMEAVAALGDAAVCIHYENLIERPEAEIRELCNRLGLAFDAAMLDYAATPMAESEFGDQEKIARHDHAVADYADRWREGYNDEQRAELAREVLDDLGWALVTAMGYDYEDARAVIDSAGRSEASASADALTRDGESRFAAGELEVAESLFRQAITVDPDFALAHNNLGVLQATRGEHDAAVDCFNKALAVDPRERDAMINLLECASLADRLGDTLPGLAAYLEAVPDDEEIIALAREITETMENAAVAPSDESPAPIPALPRGPEILVPGVAPRISLVTPSYNQGDYLEECIDSILSQNYPNLDYIIMDGGSTDQSVSIIKRYQKYLSHWQSGKDDGQYAAIEAGLKRSNGEIMAWLNSDDKYHADALWKVSYAFMTRPQVEWLTGLYTFWDARGTLTGVLDPVYWTQAQQLDPNDMRTVQQESTFWRRSLWERAGAYLATELYYAGDWDLWTRFFAHADLHTLEWTLGGYRYHEGQKVGNDASGYTAEANKLLEQELVRLQTTCSSAKEATPAPLRYTDEELLELRVWRESNIAAPGYTSRSHGQKKTRTTRSRGAKRLPSVHVVTSVTGDPGDNDAALESWLAAGWQVISVNSPDNAAQIASRYPAIEVVESRDVATLRDDIEVVTFRAIVDRASDCDSDVVGIIQPDVIMDHAQDLSRHFSAAPAKALYYGEKYAVNSTAVLDGIVDGYGYFFSAPQNLKRFNPGQLTFGHEWWIHWMLMTAIADDFNVCKIAEPFAYRIRKPFATRYDEQVQSSKACIASVLAQYLPAEFKTIPSLKLSFDIESGDFEKFARSFVGSRAA